MKTSYHSHYDENTFIKRGECANGDDMLARHEALRDFGVEASGERWVEGYGWTLAFEGPPLDELTQNLLCIKEVKRDY
jgi:hypothetical protein